MLQPQLPVEIVSVDSVLVYRGMDIGSAKPGVAARARLAHHLIDIRDPAESYSAGEFVRDARAAIAAIHGRGRVPLLVGGTMLYLRALRDGLALLPPASAALRRELDAQAASDGWPALHAELERGRCRSRGAHCPQRCAANPARARGASTDRRADVAMATQYGGRARGISLVALCAAAGRRGATGAPTWARASMRCWGPDWSRRYARCMRAVI